MMGYLSLAGVALIYYGLQTYFPKKVAEDHPDFEKDTGYLQPILDNEMDDHFEHWFDDLKPKEETVAAKDLKDSSDEDNMAKKEGEESEGEA